MGRSEGGYPMTEQSIIQSELAHDVQLFFTDTSADDLSTDIVVISNGIFEAKWTSKSSLDVYLPYLVVETLCPSGFNTFMALPHYECSVETSQLIIKLYQIFIQKCSFSQGYRPELDQQRHMKVEWNM